ncbi:hypothetical protein M422DRAFT_51733 [Sphaerobolus stellatus SS14]|uniref:Fungal-type protein kinase domain-containing protein n=1 Tax=Sphaerobolus stellatus (strain SS14) TaxID=990650 RepID=A0A0C9TX43_SPHS4|nr:hypothetical protein M422DRAFT_51733 [Sphaerobolus stellatus SS14]
MLYTPLKELFSPIIPTAGNDYHPENLDAMYSRRLCLKTSNCRMYPKLFALLSPCLLFAGSGKFFINVVGATRPLHDFMLAICPMEVRPADKKKRPYRDRLAVHMTKLFEFRYNRRFAFGLVISNTALTLYLSDRMGVLCSAPFNYYDDPVQICAIIAGLSSLDPENRTIPSYVQDRC